MAKRARARMHATPVQDCLSDAARRFGPEQYSLVVQLRDAGAYELRKRYHGPIFFFFSPNDRLMRVCAPHAQVA